jgi:PERQ amino acid-rich with GYF domain-containing protein
MDIAENTRPRRSNGAILRRQSNAPLDQSSQPEPTVETRSAETQDVQPPVHPSHETFIDPRYTKDRLLDIYKAQQNSDAPSRDVSNLFVGNWDPGHLNGTNGRGWGKSHDGRDSHGPTVCWDANGSVQPIGLEEMSDVERSVSSLNNLVSFLT